MILAVLRTGPVEFAEPKWLLLIPAAWLLTAWIARRTLSGMATGTRIASLVVRLLVIALICAALAEPHTRREARDVSVIAILDSSRSVPLDLQSRAEQYIRDAIPEAHSADLLALITAASRAYVHALPGPPDPRLRAAHPGGRDTANLAEAVRLALAIRREDAANRIVLASDGNETAGSLLAAADAARAAGVPIDVLPLRFRHDNEVIVERLVAPATARKNEPVNLRVVISSTGPAIGDLHLMLDGDPIDLDPDTPGAAARVTLDAGINVKTVPVTLPEMGPQRFEAIFEPLPDDRGIVADTIPENNRALAVTFVSGEGRVLVLAQSPDEAEALLGVLEQANIDADLRSPSQAPDSLIELGGYDAVILVNTPAHAFSHGQQEDLRTYVHDLGGGLIKIGGPDAFGAGGWIGSPLADALPVRLDLPARRQMPRGALALLMHSCEMPQGNYWGQQTALAAVDALSRLDLAGVVEFSWRDGGFVWAHPLEPVGNKQSITRAINNLSFGDAKDFEAMMSLAIGPLEQAAAGQKHAIIISDGDPAPPRRATLQRYINANVTVTTVLVFPHVNDPNHPDWQGMRDIARVTGGNFYTVTRQADLSTLPQIFIKEAQTVRRSLIWEGDPFSPAVAVGISEPLRGIGPDVPPISGYVATSEREGLALVSMRGQEDDPILAHWQHGLGRAVAFTSDATTRWAQQWTAWPGFRAFWEQHVRWAMRPTGDANVRVITEDRGDTTRIVVEAAMPDGEALNFARFRGRVAGPGGHSEPVSLRQVGPGRYEGYVESAREGTYVVNLRYDAPGADDQTLRGNVQAAITRPFADEYRFLTDNSALLQQVASLTGGRVLGPDPAQAGLWSRDGLTMPVATRPIWLAVACVAIALFLIDVGVRRVRIDPRAIAASVTRALSSRKEKTAQELSALKQARRRAREGIDTDAQQTHAAARAQQDPAVRSVKFEADPSRPGAPADAPGVVGPGDAPGDPRPERKPKPTDADKADPEQGMSRLLKAKRRARGELENDGDNAS